MHTIKRAWSAVAAVWISLAAAALAGCGGGERKAPDVEIAKYSRQGLTTEGFVPPLAGGALLVAGTGAVGKIDQDGLEEGLSMTRIERC
jgi:hypothetical protein